MFGLWYPGAYRLMAGGRELFVLVTTVDVVLGPLLTFAVFNLKKGWPHLRRDLAVIGVIQLAALGYGLHTVYEARPVAMVFEVDRFRVIIAADVHTTELPQALPAYRSLSLDGPWLLGASVAGRVTSATMRCSRPSPACDVASGPSSGSPTTRSRATRWPSRARSTTCSSATRNALPSSARRLEEVRLAPAQARFLPVMARGDWVAVLDPKGDIATFLAVDGFF